MLTLYIQTEVLSNACSITHFIINGLISFMFVFEIWKSNILKHTCPLIKVISMPLKEHIVFNSMYNFI